MYSVAIGFCYDVIRMVHGLKFDTGGNHCSICIIELFMV